MQQQIFCHEKLAALNDELKKSKIIPSYKKQAENKVAYHQEQAEKAKHQLAQYQQLKNDRDSLVELERQAKVLYAFARQLVAPIEQSTTALARIPTVEEVMRREQPFQSIIELVRSFNILSQAYRPALRENDPLKIATKQLKSVLLKASEYYRIKDKTEKLIIDYSAMALIQDKELYHSVIESTLRAVKEKILSNPVLLKHLAFILYQDNYQVLSSEDCSICLALMLKELENFPHKSLENKHACLDAIQALLDVWLYLNVNQLQAGQKLEKFELIKPGKDNKTPRKQCPKRVEEYNELYHKLGEIKSSIEDDGNLWFKATCARQTLLHIGSDESQRELTLRKGEYFAKGTLYLGAAAGCLALATVVTGQSIKSALENTRAAGEEFKQLIHTKEGRKACYWPLRQFQTNIASFIINQPSTPADEAVQFELLAAIRETLHGHRYLLFAAFNTLFVSLGT